jgi:hypothetical protein
MIPNRKNLETPHKDKNGHAIEIGDFVLAQPVTKHHPLPQIGLVRDWRATHILIGFPVLHGGAEDLYQLPEECEIVYRPKAEEEAPPSEPDKKPRKRRKKEEPETKPETEPTKDPPANAPTEDGTAGPVEGWPDEAPPTKTTHAPIPE